jgi:hypothetical protein
LSANIIVHNYGKLTSIFGLTQGGGEKRRRRRKKGVMLTFNTLKWSLI